MKCVYENVINNLFLCRACKLRIYKICETSAQLALAQPEGEVDASDGDLGGAGAVELGGGLVAALHHGAQHVTHVLDLQLWLMVIITA